MDIRKYKNTFNIITITICIWLSFKWSHPTRITVHKCTLCLNGQTRVCEGRIGVLRDIVQSQDDGARTHMFWTTYIVHSKRTRKRMAVIAGRDWRLMLAIHACVQDEGYLDTLWHTQCWKNTASWYTFPILSPNSAVKCKAKYAGNV